MHKRRLGSDLEVANHRVALAAEEDHVRVGVVQREHHAVAGVQLDHDDRLGQHVRSSQGILPLGHFAEARREDQATPGKMKCFKNVLVHDYVF